MKRGLLLAGFLLLAAGVNAQTARIAHRSHSGSNRSFNVNEEDNFGLPYKPETVKADSTRKNAQVTKDTPRQAPVRQAPVKSRRTRKRH